MFEGITHWIISSIQSYGIWAVIMGIAIETIIVPIPSPLVLMTAGAILVDPTLPLMSALIEIFIKITIPAAIASTIGSYLVYGVGYFGGRPIIDKYEKLHGVSWNEIKMFQKKFKGRKEDITLALLRAIPIMPLSVISGVAGVMKMEWKKFTLWTFIGMIPRAFVLTFIGWKMSNIYVTMADSIDHMESIVTILLVLMIGGYIVGHKTGLFNKIRQRVLK